METIDLQQGVVGVPDWYYLAALLQTLFIYVVRKNPDWPILKYPKAWWYKIPDGWRWVGPTLLGASVGFTDAFWAGESWIFALKAAALGALSVGVTSMGINALLTDMPGPWNRKPPKKSEKEPMKPADPPPSFASVAAFALVLLLGCAPTRDVVWPSVARCTPSMSTITQDVAAELDQDPGASLTSRGKKAMETLARKHGPEMVVCAVRSLVDRLAVSQDPADTKVRDKGEQFLSQIGTDFEED